MKNIYSICVYLTASFIQRELRDIVAMKPDEKLDFDFNSFSTEISRFNLANFKNTLPEVSQQLDWALLGFAFIITLCCLGAHQFQTHVCMCAMI